MPQGSDARGKCRRMLREHIRQDSRQTAQTPNPRGRSRFGNTAPVVTCLRRRVPAEGQGAKPKLVDQHGQGVNVVSCLAPFESPTALIGRRAAAPGRHATDPRSQGEIDQARHISRSQQHVARLQISVNDPGAMKIVHCPRHLDRQRHPAPRRRPCQRNQVAAAQVLHHDPWVMAGSRRRARDSDKARYGNNIRMRYRAEEFELAANQRPGGGRRVGAWELDCYSLSASSGSLMNREMPPCPSSAPRLNPSRVRSRNGTFREFNSKPSASCFWKHAATEPLPRVRNPLPTPPTKPDSGSRGGHAGRIGQRGGIFVVFRVFHDSGWCRSRFEFFSRRFFRQRLGVDIDSAEARFLEIDLSQ